MIITTGNDIPGKDFEILGIAKGNIVRAKNIGRDIMAGFKNMAGGEIKSYTDLTSESREMAYSRMEEVAQAMGADAIIAMRFASASIMEGTTEILCYGTAVKLK